MVSIRESQKKKKNIRVSEAFLAPVLVDTSQSHRKPRVFIMAEKCRVANSGSGIHSGTDQFQCISVPVPRKRHDFSLEMHWILDEKHTFQKKIRNARKNKHDCVRNSITVYHNNAFTVCFVVFDEKTHFTL